MVPSHVLVNSKSLVSHASRGWNSTPARVRTSLTGAIILNQGGDLHCLLGHCMATGTEAEHWN